jgi:hypothetical protein
MEGKLVRKTLMVACLVGGMPIWLSSHAAANDQAACVRQCQIERERNVKICQQEDGLGDCYSQHNIVAIYGNCRAVCRTPHHEARRALRKCRWDAPGDSPVACTTEQLNDIFHPGLNNPPRQSEEDDD